MFMVLLYSMSLTAFNQFPQVVSYQQMPETIQTISVMIPPNTSTYNQSYNQNVQFPPFDCNYRYISRVVVHIDTAGLYNIITPQTFEFWHGATPSSATFVTSVTLQPGYYTLADFTAIFSPTYATFPISGANAFKTIFVTDYWIKFTNASAVAAIIGYPSANNTSLYGHVSPSSIDFTYGLDTFQLFTSIVAQATVGSTCPIITCAIDTEIGKPQVFNSGYTVIPLRNVDAAADITWSLKDPSGNPFSLSTPIFVSLQILSQKKYNQFVKF